MISVINNIILLVLNPIAIVFTIILAVPVFWTWWEVTIGRKRRQKRLFLDIPRRQGERTSAILVVDLNPRLDIWSQVLVSIHKNSDLKSIPEKRIFHIKRDKWLNPEDMIEFVEEIRKNLGKIAESGADTIYLIYAGPVTAAAIIGGELSNTFQVFLLQYQEGVYTNWGPLKHTM